MQASLQGKSASAQQEAPLFLSGAGYSVVTVGFTCGVSSFLLCVTVSEGGLGSPSPSGAVTALGLTCTWGSFGFLILCRSLAVRVFPAGCPQALGSSEESLGEEGCWGRCGAAPSSLAVTVLCTPRGAGRPTCASG